MTGVRRGFLMMEAVVGLFLIFLAAMVTLTSLHTSDRGYTQATQIRVGLRLAREGLEAVRAGTVNPTVGLQKLTPIQQRVGRSSLTYRPELEVKISANLLLVYSRVRWNDGKSNHVLELKTFVAP
ncbi:hypothetical protein IV102_11990 [bacterium]|nr:hypothetical protein [bacterium]